MSKLTIMEVFSDFQVYIEQEQDVREVFVILLLYIDVSWCV